MEKLRKPLQGVTNIIRFNWHFYGIAILLVLILLILNPYLDKQYQTYVILISITIIICMTTTLLVSYYIYDFSNLYDLDWLIFLKVEPNSNLINIHSGFDETSILLANKYPNSNLNTYDFYNPKKHTEISIKRAREIYKSFPNTTKIKTESIALKNNSVNIIFLIFSAHEIRQNKERILFFKELNRILKPNGQIIVTEHLRNLPNLIAYNIGFFHFLSKKTWLHTFNKSNFRIQHKTKITPFITTFNLIKNGNTP